MAAVTLLPPLSSAEEEVVAPLSLATSRRRREQPEILRPPQGPEVQEHLLAGWQWGDANSGPV